MTAQLSSALTGAEAPPDRVRAHSGSEQNHRIDVHTQQCLERHATSDRDALTLHLETLDSEWDVELYGAKSTKRRTH